MGTEATEAHLFTQESSSTHALSQIYPHWIWNSKLNTKLRLEFKVEYEFKLEFQVE